MRGYRSFARNDSGSIAIIFAVAFSGILGAVGLAIDYGQYVRAKQATQFALDAAVLAASSVNTSDEEVRQDRFNKVFDAQLKPGVPRPDVLKFDHTSSSGGKGTAEFSMKTSFMRALGVNFATAKLVSEAQTSAQDLEIVFVLDISGSMTATDMGGGTRLDALKSSVGKLIDLIEASRHSSQSIKYAVVPFNMAVNIGTAHASIVANTTHALFAGTEWAGCVLERPDGFHAKDTYSPGSTNGSGKFPAYIWPPEPDTGTCLNPSNGTNSGYRSVEATPLGKDPWATGPNFNCPRYPIQRLTSSESTVRTALSDLRAYGNMGTVVGPGVGWGLRLLSPSGPFGDGASFSAKTRKVMVVVTDGEMVTDGGSCRSATNSSSAYAFDPKSIGLQGRTLSQAPEDNSFTPYGYLVDSDPYNKSIYTRSDADKELDRLSIEACTEAKSRHTGPGAIEIFTIAASTGAGPGTRAETVLSQCASKPGNFLYAADATALDTAFQKIGEAALGLRLTN